MKYGSPKSNYVGGYAHLRKNGETITIEGVYKVPSLCKIVSKKRSGGAFDTEMCLINSSTIE